MEGSVHYTWMESPVGKLLLVADSAGVRQIVFADKKTKPDPLWIEDRHALRDVVHQLRDYFAGERHDFDLPLSPEGTAFQRQVWDELMNIPYGETISYGELANRIGNPKAVRAVGLANGSNPLPIVIPCHRVIGSNGKLTGYGGGLHNKEWLLALEKKSVSPMLAGFLE